jgi:hypothetical protein
VSTESAVRAGSSVVVYLSVSLRSRLRAFATASGRSHTQIVFDALNATHDKLSALVTAGGPASAAADGIFLAQRTGRRQHREDQVQVSIRPHPANLAVIDQLAALHTVGNRSALIAVALEAFLPTAGSVDEKGVPA